MLPTCKASCVPETHDGPPLLQLGWRNAAIGWVTAPNTGLERPRGDRHKGRGNTRQPNAGDLSNNNAEPAA